MRVLLVEDDAMLGAVIERTLKENAYAVDRVMNGQDAELALLSQEYAVMLLDLGLPGKDGLAVLAAVRETGNALPVVIITARDAVDDRVNGLDLGADDYMVKPFAANELLARMRAVIRRGGGAAASVLGNGDISLNLVTREMDADGVRAVLSAREFSLMRALLIRPGAILSRAQLEEAIYGWNEEVESNAVEVIIHSVRKKFGQRTIKNVRGAGWLVRKG